MLVVPDPLPPGSDPSLAVRVSVPVPVPYPYPYPYPTAPRRTRRRGPRVGPPRAAADGRRTGFVRSSRPRPLVVGGTARGSRGRSPDGRGAGAGLTANPTANVDASVTARAAVRAAGVLGLPTPRYVTSRKTPRPILYFSGIFRAPHRERRGARVGCDPGAGRDPAREDVHSRFIVRGLGSASTEAPGAGEEEAPTAIRLGTHHAPGNRDVTEELPTGKRGRGSPYRREWDRPP